MGTETSDPRLNDKFKFKSFGDNNRRRYMGEVAKAGFMTSQRIYTSASSPTVNNDGFDTAGIRQVFEPADLWYNSTLGVRFQCLDNSQAAAVWSPIATFGFGGIHVHDNSTAQSIPAGTTYTKSTVFTHNNTSFNVGSDAANDKITLTYPGIYSINGAFSFVSGTNNVVWYAAPFLGGVEYDEIHFVRKIQTAGDIGSAGFAGFIDSTTAGADLDVRFRHDNIGAVDLTIVYANFNVVYLKET